MMDAERDVARVYFLDASGGEARSPEELEHIVIVSLRSHMDNVRRMVEAWCAEERSPLWEEVIFAAVHHDDGKPARFAIEWDPARRQFLYAFRGHRFDAAHRMEEEHPYAARLVREHHTFATEDVVKAVADLRDMEESGALPARAWRHFVHDLYVLEVCDNLAADVETRIFAPTQDEQDAMHRDFVEYAVRASGGTLTVEPWPFDGDRLVLHLASLSLRVDQFGDALHADLARAKGEEHAELQNVRERVQEAACEDARWERKEVTLWRR